MDERDLADVPAAARTGLPTDGRNPGAGDASPLFRHAPLPSGLELVDVHVNALPAGFASPPGFYSSVGIDAVLADPDGRGDAGERVSISGGLVAPPAGVDLLAASLALRDACAAHRADRAADRADEPQAASPAFGWRALLRFDAGGGPSPPANPVDRLLRSAPFGAVRSLGRRAAEGAVGRAVLAEPALLADFAGVKLMPQHTGLPGREVLERLSASARPVLVHAGIQCPPRWLERHLLPHLDAPIVLAHLGSWPCSADDLEQALALAERDPRVHLETSGANIGNFLRVAAARVPERLLFGSNRPMCPPHVQFAHVASSIADDSALRALAAGNARRLYGAMP